MADTSQIVAQSTTLTAREDTGKPLLEAIKSSENALHIAEQGNPSGTRNIGSVTNAYLVSFNNWNATRLDIDTTETLVTNAPCLVGGVFGNDGNTGYTDLIDAAAIASGNTPKFRVNLGDGVNPTYLGGVRFELGLSVDGESAGHDVTVLWRPI